MVLGLPRSAPLFWKLCCLRVCLPPSALPVSSHFHTVAGTHRLMGAVWKKGCPAVCWPQKMLAVKVRAKGSVRDGGRWQTDRNGISGKEANCYLSCSILAGGLQSVLFPGLADLNQEVGKTCLLTVGWGYQARVSKTASVSTELRWAFC